MIIDLTSVLNHVYILGMFHNLIIPLRISQKVIADLSIQATLNLILPNSEIMECEKTSVFSKKVFQSIQVEKIW